MYFDIWTKENPIAVEAYRQDNYLISSNQNGNGFCYVYCSSNEIWYPNEQDIFEEAIVRKNRFEWARMVNPNASKTILIRDIYKSWYVTGINDRINSIDKLVDFIKQEADGLKLVTIGSSSGGYLAILLGVLLDASYVIAFSPQMTLYDRKALGGNLFLKRYEEDENRACYYDLKPYLSSTATPVYYILPIKNDWDYSFYEYTKDVECLRRFSFKSRFHGVVMYRSCLEKFISLDSDEIEKLYQIEKGKRISPFMFSVRSVGLVKSIQDFLMKALKYYKKRRK